MNEDAINRSSSLHRSAYAVFPGQIVRYGKDAVVPNRVYSYVPAAAGNPPVVAATIAAPHRCNTSLVKRVGSKLTFVNLPQESSWVAHMSYQQH